MRNVFDGADTAGPATLVADFPKVLGAVDVANLLEDEVRSLHVSKRKVSVDVLGFGIQTLKFSLSGRSNAIGAPDSAK